MAVQLELASAGHDAESEYERMTPARFDKRTCPWCGSVEVHAFSDEAIHRALADHLASCQGPATSVAGQATD
jgi:hypothetical protein